MKRLLLLLLAFLCLSTLSACANPAATQEPEPALSCLGNFESPDILESSGLVESSFSEAFWTMNDSGNETKLFLVANDGKLIAELSIKKSKNIDWESLSKARFGGQSYLIIGDVGDNSRKRKHCSLYYVKEPRIAHAEKPQKLSEVARRVDFVFQGGPINCEAIAADQQGGFVWLIEKGNVDKRSGSSPGVFQLPLTMAQTGKPLTAKRKFDFPLSQVTGMDISPDGQQLIVRSYWSASRYSRDRFPDWETRLAQQNPTSVALPIQLQGEAVCFLKDNKSVLLTSEGKFQPIWKLDLKVKQEE